jgi:hypothetical protein
VLVSTVTGVGVGVGTGVTHFGLGAICACPLLSKAIIANRNKMKMTNDFVDSFIVSPF